MTYLHSYRTAPFRFLLVWAFGAVLLSACSKEKKSASSPAGPDTLRTEDIRTIERQYDQQPQSLPPEAQGESSLNQAVDQIDRLENQDEMQVAIQALHKDVAMIQVTPMDSHGNFSYALAASHLADMMARAKCIIVEVNQNMPWVYGLTGTEINIQDVDFVVEGDNPPVAQLGGGGEPTDVDRAVANLVVPEIPNGACLQLGIGGMPNTIGAMIAQSDLKDLSVHTEMYVDGFVDIAAAGKITGRHKNRDKGRQVFAFAAGTQKLYDYVNRNPDVMAAPVDYTNDVRVIGQIDNFISINNAVDLDLFGQVNAESAGLKHISGTGGQLDFVMGAYLSKGGKSFICLSSTVTGKDGTMKSRIVPTLTNGSICTDPRSCVHYIVTEYGMVNLKGLSTWERAEALISIAHPNFREELIQSAEKMGIWRRSNKR